MTEARVPVTVEITSEDIVAANALDDALGFLTDNERPLVLIALARHRLAGVAAGREEAWRDGFNCARRCLTDDEAFCLTEDVEQDAWVDSKTTAAIRQIGQK